AKAAPARVSESGGLDRGNLARQLAEAQAKIAVLQHEVDAADNVRQFAANTEREIAQFQRELREAKAKVTQLTLERDRLESQLRDVREDSDTTSRRAPIYDPDATAQADIAKYEQIIAKAGDLQDKMIKMEKDNERMRRELADAEGRLSAQKRAQEDEPTRTGSAVPLEFAEHLSVLEESIDSLRANMRAASDETAMMDQSDSVAAVAGAVSQAAEHVERARQALKILAKYVETHS
ncbi:MAG: hypothetical protein JWO36_3459, partial [Myxococcales bacterium]|nr:hypothetical protein [Myxococcales bacterium]